MRTFYWAWSLILFAAIIVQIGLAGYGAFYAANKLEDEGSTIDEDVFFDGFELHAGWGYLVILLGLLFMVIGLIAGIGKWRLGRHGLLFAAALRPAVACLDRLRAAVPGRVPSSDQRRSHRCVEWMDRLGRVATLAREESGSSRSGPGRARLASSYSGSLWCSAPIRNGVLTPA